MTSVDTVPPAPQAESAPDASPASLPIMRMFSHFGLVRMLGRSSVTIAWLAVDTRTGQPVRLLASRQPINAQAVRERCLDDARRAARLVHPRLMPVRDIGCVDRFPYLTCDVDSGHLPKAEERATPMPLKDIVRHGVELLEGLAYAHEGSVLHGDLGLHTVAIDAAGHLQLWGLGLGVALMGSRPGGVAQVAGLATLFGREVAAASLLIQHGLIEGPPLGEPDMPTLLDRWPATDMRLPHELPVPIPDSLRLIINRGVESNPQRRYIQARSFERALSGWHQTQMPDQGGFDAMLAERLRRAGHLPAMPALSQRVMSVGAMEKQRLDDMVDLLLEDVALSLAMLRAANSAEIAAANADADVTTVHRAMQLMGTNGLRRVANSLKPWPGLLKPTQAALLEQAMNRAHLAGHLAAFLAPAGLDAEMALLAAQFQNLGALLAAYHFPDEVQQIARLVASGAEAGTEGLSITEELAATSVIGVDLPGLAAAFLRVWGLAESLRALVRPLSRDRAVRAPTSPQGWARVVGSYANEVVAVAELPQPAQPEALSAVVGRYRSALALDEAQVRHAMRRARDKLGRHLR